MESLSFLALTAPLSLPTILTKVTVSAKSVLMHFVKVKFSNPSTSNLQTMLKTTKARMMTSQQIINICWKVQQTPQMIIMMKIGPNTRNSTL
jgi:hypothetical protein